MKPAEFARFVETVGIGRTKADRLMTLARLRVVEVDEMRPSAWGVVFGGYEPIPMLPGEADAVISEAVADAEPPEYRHRADLLSADGLLLMLVAMHRPEAASVEVLAIVEEWLAGADGSAALEILRDWRSNERGQTAPPDATRETQIAPQEALQ